LIETQCVPETIAPLVEIIPIQIAAARLAAIKGLPVGALRHAQSITRDEIAF
jgi:glucosamine 6-phosphate synthetase-like amidotransferase/phosphosugar isomerase protein